MDWIVGSLIIVGVSSALIIASVRRRPSAPRVPGSTDETLGRRVRRLEEEMDDLGTQVAQLRDDVQDLMRQLEDRD